MNLLEYLENYNKKNMIPMHMPGHKRNIELAPYLKKLYANCDFTEIYGMDDLHSPESILKEAMIRAENLWNSKHSYYLVNGSTGGILAGIRACTNRGDYVLVARNCHKSVYNAIEICGLKPIYILPNMIADLPIYSSVNPQIVYNQIEKNKKIKLVIITSPTYEGIISDIGKISEIAHSFDIPVLVDEAHGAHLDISPYFIGGAVKNGADVIVQSLHKTLPSLTQTGIIHLNSDIIKPEKLQQQLSVFQTSSPSYLFMSSIDNCVNFLGNNIITFQSWNENLNVFKNKVLQLKKLQILNYTKNADISKEVFLFDKSKIVISTSYTSISGNELMQILRNNYNIELEMCSGDYVIAMTSMADSKENLLSLANALIDIDSKIKKTNRECFVTSIKNLPKMDVDFFRNINQETEIIDITNAVGKTSNEYIWIYPPGIPIITPGEIITSETIDIIMTVIEKKMNLQKTVCNKNTDISVINSNSKTKDLY
ncbi:MAG: aminotransferase class I/II-fold pyridoxal phosphate-dependent enzyme [Acutalibacteraceae bacterium]|nr:aminotransferase class I/II-fold pyridoxal phosphate-dependent enzyme [Acutalibacteraceae bacterium]